MAIFIDDKENANWLHKRKTEMDPVLEIWNSLPVKTKIELENELHIHTLGVLFENKKIREYILGMKKPVILKRRKKIKILKRRIR